MNIGPRDRLTIQNALRETRQFSRLIYILIPTFTNTNYDTDTQSGRDVSVGDGTGRTVTWKHVAVRAHLRLVNQALITYGAVPPGVQVGNTVVNVGLRDKALLDEAYANEHSYVFIDGETFRLVSTLAAGIGQVEEWAGELIKFNPTYRAAGF